MMSPASKSKSKDKKSGKDPQKGSSKPGNANPGSVALTSGYNPVLKTFHTLETAPMTSASPIQINGRFRNIDESDDHSGNLLGTGTEYDSVSNNGSWSGESEDHKDKLNIPLKQEVIPGADNDKREKIRQKNERKHQRQKERRAQELHERCNGYLMSRKLEALAQQLVAMGISSERATMALILNEGRVEESVSWLFEGAEETEKHMEHSIDGGYNLKIDISEELARVADLENRYKCTKQEVERAIVACEGDLDKAAETLRAQKQDPPATPPKPEETGDPPTVSNGKLPAVIISQNSSRVPPKPSSSTAMPLKRDDNKDFNYTKPAVTVAAPAESGNKNVQPLRRIQQKFEWAKPQQTATQVEKRWSNAGSNSSVSYSLASPLQASPPPAKAESRYLAMGNEFKNGQLGSVREPVIVMQRPSQQPLNTKQGPTTSVNTSPPGTAAGWYPNGIEMGKQNGLSQHIPSTRSLSPSNFTSNQLYNHQFQYQQHQQFVPSNGSVDPPVTSRGNVSWSRTGTSPTLAAASSLGLFSGLGSNGSSGSSSPVDWNAGGPMPHLDYTNIDWSLDAGMATSRGVGLWHSIKPNSSSSYESYNSGYNSARTGMRPLSNGNGGVSVAGLQEGGAASAETTAGGSREWSSPFEEKDLFSLPRQFVSSPSL